LTPNPHKHSGWRRLVNAFGYSMTGLRTALAHEAAFRQEVALAVVLVPVAMLANVSALERAVLVWAVLFVLAIELINSAVEAAIDRVSLENHPLAKRAKDLGSAAVFVSLVSLIAVWALILTA